MMYWIKSTSEIDLLENLTILLECGIKYNTFRDWTDPRKIIEHEHPYRIILFDDDRKLFWMYQRIINTEIKLLTMDEVLSLDYFINKRPNKRIKFKKISARITFTEKVHL